MKLCLCFRLIVLSIIAILLIGGSLFAYAQPAAAPTVHTDPPSSIGFSSVVFYGSVNPGGLATAAWFEYGTTQSLGSTAPSQPVGGGLLYVTYSARISGLEPDTVYYVRAVAQNSQGTSYGQILYFAMDRGPATLPAVTTNSASSVVGTSATLNATVTPNGAPTHGWFEWGTTVTLGNTTLSGFQNLGSGVTPASYTYILVHLTPGATYYYRAVASNAAGTVVGSVVSFTTTSAGGGSGGIVNPGGGTPSPAGGSFPAGGRPSVATLPASFISRNAALLNGTANPQGDFTSAWFEWGRTLSLGSATAFQPMGNGVAALEYSFALSGLTPGTTYYYQAVARNNRGVERGARASFVTSVPGVSIAPPPPRVVVIRSRPLPSPPAAVVPRESATIVLTPSVDNYSPRAGEEFTLTVLYRNEGNAPAWNLVMKAVLPQEVEYVSANLPPRSPTADTHEFLIGELGTASQGALTLRLKVKESVEEGSVLILQSVAEYRNSAGEEGTTSVFLAVVVGDGGGGSAALLEALRGVRWWAVFLLLLVFAFLLFLLLFIRRKRKEEGRKEAAELPHQSRI